jgi:hypothetical protein
MEGAWLGQNACNGPYIEGYRGKIVAKNAFLPKK